MNILQVVTLMHRYLKGDLTFSELPTSDQVEKAKQDYQEMSVVLRNLVNNLPQTEIELAREVWGNTNTRIVSEARKDAALFLDHKAETKPHGMDLQDGE